MNIFVNSHKIKITTLGVWDLNSNRLEKRKNEISSKDFRGGDARTSPTRKYTEVSHFFASRRASELWKNSAYSELGDTQGIGTPQSLNFPQNSLAQSI